MSALTPSQQKLVVDHMRLVDLCVRQQAHRLAPPIASREQEDMFQEGVLGLMEAVRRYRTGTCGAFVSYASAYIRGAICRHLARQQDGLTVPKHAFRQALKRRRESGSLGAEGPAPTTLPEFLDLESCLPVLTREIYLRWRRDLAAERQERAGHRMSGQRFAGCDGDGDGTTATEVWSRYERAVHAAAAELKASGRGRSDYAALVDACVQERLLVVMPSYRTSSRALARRFGSSAGRVIGCQRQLLRRVRQQLAEGQRHEPNESLIRWPACPPGLGKARLTGCTLDCRE